MAYADDVRSLKALEKYRMAALIAAIVLLVVHVTTDLNLEWPRALAWACAGVIGIKEALVVKRLGRSPDAYYLRSVLYFAVAVTCVIW